MISKISKQFGKKLVALTACLFAAGFVFAQEETSAEPAEEKEDVMILTVEDAVNYAAEHSLTLQTSALDLELAKWKNDTSWNTFLPNVQLTGNLSRQNDIKSSINSAKANAKTYSALGERLPSPLGDAYKGMASAMESQADSMNKESMHWAAVGILNISFSFNAAMIVNMINTKESYESGKITYEEAVRSNEKSVRTLFYALLLQQESLRLQKDSLENARQRMNQASVNYRNGYVPQIQYLQAQVAYENQVPSVEKAELSLAQSVDSFSFLIGLPVGTKIELKGNIEPEFIEPDIEMLYAKAKENNLSIKALKQSLKTLKNQRLALDLSTYTPSFSIGWTGQPVIANALESDWSKSDNWNDGGSLSFSIVWNLTNMLPWSSSRSSAKELAVTIEKLELNLKTLERNTELEVKKAVDNLDLCRRSIETSQRNITLAQKSYDMTWLAYRNGTTEYLNLVEAQTQLNQAKLGLISEKYNYMTGLMNLEDIINTTLSGDK